MNTNPIEARLIPLAQIHPDPAQPRHLLPSELAQALENGASPIEILSQLRSRAEHNKWIRERLTELDALAASIGEDGLIQPIRVIRTAQSPTQDHDSEDLYRIEEGERRWWAHHILVQQGRTQFQSIAAFVVDANNKSKGVLRRRVAENVLRSGFTAIELAQAMNSRVQEIMTAEPGIKRTEAEKRVGSENNMTDRRVRQYVALLTLTPEAQKIAQDARLAESALRHVVGIKDPSKQLDAINQLIHPTPKPKGRSSSHEGKRLSEVRTKRNPKRGSRLASRPSNRRKHLANSAKGKEIRSRGAPNAITQKVERLLALAKSFTKGEIEQMKETDLLLTHCSMMDRRAMANLWLAIGVGLLGNKVKKIQGAIAKDE